MKQIKENFDRKKKHTQRERKIIYKCIGFIENTLGGYVKTRPIVSRIEDYFGLKESLAFKEACMVGRFDTGTNEPNVEIYF